MWLSMLKRWGWFLEAFLGIRNEGEHYNAADVPSVWGRVFGQGVGIKVGGGCLVHFECMIVMGWVLCLVLFLGCFVWLSTSCPWLKIAMRERVGRCPKIWWVSVLRYGL